MRGGVRRDVYLCRSRSGPGDHAGAVPDGAVPGARFIAGIDAFGITVLAAAAAVRIAVAERAAVVR
ncbi:hypothetical protein [Actinomadura sp. 9N407]|uniref:hypothetical protein n=1 Tax=Actinomadura sp. 9N407 TaxID=3375154 RepID=UPI0037891BB6